MRSRTWRWLQAKIVQLLTAPPAGHTPIPVDEGQRVRFLPVWRTRIQRHFFGEEA